VPTIVETNLAAILDTDPLTLPIVEAITSGAELPEQWTILDTYADIGDPPSCWTAEKIRSQVHAALAARGILIGLNVPRTFTMLDHYPTEETTNAHPIAR
jgi:hypothetical protein